MPPAPGMPAMPAMPPVPSIPAMPACMLASMAGVRMGPIGMPGMPTMPARERKGGVGNRGLGVEAAQVAHGGRMRACSVPSWTWHYPDSLQYRVTVVRPPVGSPMPPMPAICPSPPDMAAGVMPMPAIMEVWWGMGWQTGVLCTPC